MRLKLRLLSLIRCSVFIMRLLSLIAVPNASLTVQAVAQAGPAENPVREAEADQRLRASDGHVRHHHHGHRERTGQRRYLHSSKFINH